MVRFSLIMALNLKTQIKSSTLLSERAFINGEWVTALSKKLFNVENPANGNIIATIPDMNAADCEAAISAASEAFKQWSNTNVKERSNLLRLWYDAINVNKKDIATIITAESGKPLSEAEGEVTYGNSFVEWFSEEARRIKGEIVPSGANNRKLYIERQPIGVVGLITPWNFPIAMITRKAAAALASGCTCVVRPAEDTPLTALALAKLAEDVGIPRGVFNVVTSSRSNASEIGKLLCQSPLVAGISFTGSVNVGKILYNQCTSGVKRLGLELGGNAPFIVYNSANVENAVQSAITAKFRNAGQACVAANRFLVQEGIYEEFMENLTEAVKKLNVGDGFEKNIQIGPLINPAQLDKVQGLVEDAKTNGAKIILGGNTSSKGGLFYQPTIIVDVNPTMRMYKEEIFGPIISVIKFKTEEESVKIANDVDVGLAAYFFSQDVSQIFRVSKNLEAGMVGVNEGLISTAEAPFGGIKQSGIGREGSHHGIEEFTYYKYICLGNLNLTSS